MDDHGRKHLPDRPTEGGCHCARASAVLLSVTLSGKPGGTGVGDPKEAAKILGVRIHMNFRKKTENFDSGGIPTHDHDHK